VNSLLQNSRLKGDHNCLSGRKLDFMGADGKAFLAYAITSDGCHFSTRGETMLGPINNK
jgi:hypothetical protein